MIHMYKNGVLSYTECRAAAIYHASVPLLQQVENVQESVLEDIGIDAKPDQTAWHVLPSATRTSVEVAIGKARCAFRSFANTI